MIVVVLVTMNGRSSVSKQRQEFTSLLLPSERERRRPLTEERDIFGNPRAMRVERQPLSSYTTSYGQHYNQVNTSR